MPKQSAPTPSSSVATLSFSQLEALLVRLTNAASPSPQQHNSSTVVGTAITNSSSNGAPSSLATPSVGVAGAESPSAQQQQQLLTAQMRTALANKATLPSLVATPLMIHPADVPELPALVSALSGGCSNNNSNGVTGGATLPSKAQRRRALEQQQPSIITASIPTSTTRGGRGGSKAVVRTLRGGAAAGATTTSTDPDAHLYRRSEQPTTGLRGGGGGGGLYPVGDPRSLPTPSDNYLGGGHKPKREERGGGGSNSCGPRYDDESQCENTTNNGRRGRGVARGMGRGSSVSSGVDGGAYDEWNGAHQGDRGGGRGLGENGSPRHTTRGGFESSAHRATKEDPNLLAAEIARITASTGKDEAYYARLRAIRDGSANNTTSTSTTSTITLADDPLIVTGLYTILRYPHKSHRVALLAKILGYVMDTVVHKADPRRWFLGELKGLFGDIVEERSRRRWGVGARCVQNGGNEQTSTATKHDEEQLLLGIQQQLNVGIYNYFQSLSAVKKLLDDLQTRLQAKSGVVSSNLEDGGGDDEAGEDDDEGDENPSVSLVLASAPSPSTTTTPSPTSSATPSPGGRATTTTTAPRHPKAYITSLIARLLVFQGDIERYRDRVLFWEEEECVPYLMAVHSYLFNSSNNDSKDSSSDTSNSSGIMVAVGDDPQQLWATHISSARRLYHPQKEALLTSLSAGSGSGAALWNAIGYRNVHKRRFASSRFGKQQSNINNQQQKVGLAVKRALLSATIKAGGPVGVTATSTAMAVVEQQKTKKTVRKGSRRNGDDADEVDLGALVAGGITATIGANINVKAEAWETVMDRFESGGGGGGESDEDSDDGKDDNSASNDSACDEDGENDYFSVPLEDEDDDEDNNNGMSKSQKAKEDPALAVSSSHLISSLLLPILARPKHPYEEASAQNGSSITYYRTAREHYSHALQLSMGLTTATTTKTNPNITTTRGVNTVAGTTEEEEKEQEEEVLGCEGLATYQIANVAEVELQSVFKDVAVLVPHMLLSTTSSEAPKIVVGGVVSPHPPTPSPTPADILTRQFIINHAVDVTFETSYLLMRASSTVVAPFAKAREHLGKLLATHYLGVDPATSSAAEGTLKISSRTTTTSSSVAATKGGGLRSKPSNQQSSIVGDLLHPIHQHLHPRSVAAEGSNSYESLMMDLTKDLWALCCVDMKRRSNYSGRNTSTTKAEESSSGGGAPPHQSSVPKNTKLVLKKKGDKSPSVNISPAVVPTPIPSVDTPLRLSDGPEERSLPYTFAPRLPTEGTTDDGLHKDQGDNAEEEEEEEEENTTQHLIETLSRNPLLTSWIHFTVLWFVAKSVCGGGGCGSTTAAATAVGASSSSERSYPFATPLPPNTSGHSDHHHQHTFDTCLLQCLVKALACYELSPTNATSSGAIGGRAWQQQNDNDGDGNNVRAGSTAGAKGSTSGGNNNNGVPTPSLSVQSVWMVLWAMTSSAASSGRSSSQKNLIHTTPNSNNPQLLLTTYHRAMVGTLVTSLAEAALLGLKTLGTPTNVVLGVWGISPNNPMNNAVIKSSVGGGRNGRGGGSRAAADTQQSAVLSAADAAKQLQEIMKSDVPVMVPATTQQQKPAAASSNTAPSGGQPEYAKATPVTVVDAILAKKKSEKAVGEVKELPPTTEPAEQPSETTTTKKRRGVLVKRKKSSARKATAGDETDGDDASKEAATQQQDATSTPTSSLPRKGKAILRTSAAGGDNATPDESSAAAKKASSQLFPEDTNTRVPHQSHKARKEKQCEEGLNDSFGFANDDDDDENDVQQTPTNESPEAPAAATTTTTVVDPNIKRLQQSLQHASALQKEHEEALAKQQAKEERAARIRAKRQRYRDRNHNNNDDDGNDDGLTAGENNDSELHVDPTTEAVETSPQHPTGNNNNNNKTPSLSHLAAPNTLPQWVAEGTYIPPSSDTLRGPRGSGASTLVGLFALVLRLYVGGYEGIDKSSGGCGETAVAPDEEGTQRGGGRRGRRGNKKEGIKSPSPSSSQPACPPQTPVHHTLQVLLAAIQHCVKDYARNNSSSYDSNTSTTANTPSTQGPPATFALMRRQQSAGGGTIATSLRPPRPQRQELTMQLPPLHDTPLAEDVFLQRVLPLRIDDLLSSRGVGASSGENGEDHGDEWILSTPAVGASDQQHHSDAVMSPEAWAAMFRGLGQMEENLPTATNTTRPFVEAPLPTTTALTTQQTPSAPSTKCKLKSDHAAARLRAAEASHNPSKDFIVRVGRLLKVMGLVEVGGMKEEVEK